MAKSYDDPAKAKTRVKLREFIKRNLKFRRPRDIRVLCFPGAEREGEEGLEIREVYDPLDIPRGNIVGLEVDYERYDRLRRADMGIRLHHTTDVEFFEKARQMYREWDVISLDYTCPFNASTSYALQLISNDGLLGNFGVLATNFMAKRENKKSKGFMASRYKLLRSRIDISEIVSSDTLFDIAKGRDSSFSLNTDRSDVVRKEIMTAFAAGRSLDCTVYNHVLGCTIVDYEDIISSIRANFPRILKGIEHRHGRNEKERLSSLIHLDYAIRKVIVEYFLSRGLSIGDIRLVEFLARRPYFPDSSESYII